MPNLRSPSIVINEIELTTSEEGITGTPATVVGTAQKGRAFVPHLVGSQNQLRARFGEVTPDTPGLHAAFRFLEHGEALSYVRVLGAGENAGFVVDADASLSNDEETTTNYFLVADHILPDTSGSPVSGIQGLSELSGVLGASGSPSDPVKLLRAQIITAYGWSLRVDDVGTTSGLTPARNTAATLDYNEKPGDGLFQLTLLKPDPDPSKAIERTYNVSLDPTSESYVGRVLNANPEAFAEKGHVLWREWPVDPTFATTVDPSSSPATLSVNLEAPRHVPIDSSVAAETGLAETGDTVAQVLGRFNDNYRASVSPWVTSQPFGATLEGNEDGNPVTKLTTRRLFRFHTIDDGTGSAERVKITIDNVRASTNDTDPYGTFTVRVRRWDDTDFDQRVLETFPNVNLNPNSSRYIARVIGDSDIFYDWQRPETERRLIRRGTYDNNSQFVWVETSEDLDAGKLDDSVLPFGYESPSIQRLSADLFPEASFDSGDLVRALPPIYRKKVTVGRRASSGSGLSKPSRDERFERRLTWGLQWERNRTGTAWNEAGPLNSYVKSLCAYLGADSLGQVLSGKEASHSLDSEFSLAFVTLPGETVDDLRAQQPASAIRRAYYARGSEITSVDSTLLTFELDDGVEQEARVSLATLLVEDPRFFNRYSGFTSFTLPLQGGWDGTNPFWKESANLSDKASGLDEFGVVPGFNENVIGWGDDNIVATSLATVAKISLNPDRTTANVIATPGWREEVIFDEFADAVRENGFLFYVGDVPAFDENGERIWTGERTRPDINFTIANWTARNIDNSYAGVYFPDVTTVLPNERGVVVPASVAGLSAIAFNDLSAFPWFAPAGFNRGSLPWVTGTVTKLRKPDRDELYDEARINPIFSGTETDNTFAILGQKTLQLEASALDRINVRRAVLEAKTILRNTMERTGLFEQNDAQTRANFTRRSLELLEPIKQLAGARKIEVICDETNNPPEDVRNRIIRASCRFVPVRVAENIVFDVFVSPDGDFSTIER